MAPRIRSLLPVLALAAFTTTGPAQDGGQEPAPQVLLEHAQQHFQAEEWPQAVRAFEIYLDRAPDDGGSRFQLGFASIRAGQYETGIEAFRATLLQGVAIEASTYNIACCYALLGRSEDALKWLAGAIDVGFSDMQLARTDPDLASIRGDARFEGILAGKGYAAPRRGAPGPAPPISTEALLAEADAHFDSARFEDAMAAYERVLQRAPGNGMAQFRMGFAAIQQKKYAAGTAAFERCIELGFAVPAATYNIACCNALQGRTEPALKWLAEAVSAGFEDMELARTDTDLDSIRGDARFQRILAGEPYQAPKTRGGGVPVERMVQHADDLFQAGRWSEAVEAYRGVIEVAPDNGAAHFRHGFASIQTGDYGAATHAFLRSRELGFQVAASTYNIACTNALLGETDSAILWLERALDAGFADTDLLATDTDLDSIRGDQRFAALQKRLSPDPAGAAPPVKSPLGPKHREFDFWEGHWDVYDAQGTKVGENRIERIHDGAALHESWRSVRGNAGSSLTFYDAEKDSWHQTWIDSSGMALHADGGMSGDDMVLSQVRGDHVDRITWTPLPDGRVRQRWQASEDGGRTWNTLFDGYYKRKKSEEF